MPVQDFPHVKVTGSPFERGTQYGEQARERVRRSVEVYAEAFPFYASLSWSEAREKACQFASVVERFGKCYVQEMLGIAQGSNLEFADILTLNTRSEIMFPGVARRAIDQDSVRFSHECTAMVALPIATADGHTLVAQNWDWLVQTLETVVVLEAEQDEGPSYVTAVEAGLLAKTGFNSSGLGVATNVLVTGHDAGQLGIPVHVSLRGILDARSVTEALASLQRLPRSSAANYMVADRAGLAINAEGSPGGFSELLVDVPSRGVLVHTNHFASPRFAGRDCGLWFVPDSPMRYQVARERLLTSSGQITPAVLRQILADHAGFPSSVCFHPDIQLEPLEQWGTVVSVVMDLDSSEMWVAAGNPCNSSYCHFDYSDFFQNGRNRTAQQSTLT